MMAVVTNGQYWEIAKRDGNGWKRVGDLPLGLHFVKTDQNAQRLWEALSKEAVEQECAKRNNSFRSTVRNRSRYGRRI